MENEQIVDEASEWFVTLREGGATDQATQSRFLAWLCRSPEHVQAYLGIVAVWTDVPSLPTREESTVDALIERARAQHNVVPLASRIPDPDAPVAMESKPVQHNGKSGIWRALAACLVLVVAGVGAAVWVTRAQTYDTGVGEQRTLRLADGSMVDLNSRSRIRVRFSDKQRLVELIEGQALFRVAKDANRVFVVSSDIARVRAVGTQFDVNRRREGTVVTVVEGRVAATNRPSGTDTARAEVLLSAGEQLTVSSTSPLAPKQADVAAVTSWTHGVLMFSSEPLSAVIDEFNRYNPRRIVLDDSVEDFPITATFASTESTMLVQFLQAQPDLHVDATDAEIRVRAAGPSAAQKK